MNRAGNILSLLLKILVLIALVAVGFFIYQACAGTPLIQKIDKSVPDSSKASFEVSTRTKIYYAEKATLNDDSTVTMNGWYERNGGKWVYHKGLITLTQVLHPQIFKR